MDSLLLKLSWTLYIVVSWNGCLLCMKSMKILSGSLCSWSIKKEWPCCIMFQLSIGWSIPSKIIPPQAWESGLGVIGTSNSVSRLSSVGWRVEVLLLVSILISTWDKYLFMFLMFEWHAHEWINGPVDIKECEFLYGNGYQIFYMHAWTMVELL